MTDIVETVEITEQLELEITQLKPKDVKPLRDRLLAEQEGKCLICQEMIDGSPNLDHDHESGKVRGVLCKACNTSEGALVRAVRHRYTRRDHVSWTNPLLFIQRVVEYWQREQHPYYHPTFDSLTGKQKSYRKTRKKQAKPKATKTKKPKSK